MTALFSRRSLLGLALAGLFALPIMPGQAQNFEFSVTPYTPEVLSAAQASGEPFLLDFFAPWCTTCRAQERVIYNLLETNAEYRDILIIRVDWDTNRTGPLVAELQIPRRSTLVVMQGTVELGRIVADTREASIAALLDLAI
jgi:thiol:disulfide interchange protein